MTRKKITGAGRNFAPRAFCYSAVRRCLSVRTRCFPAPARPLSFRRAPHYTGARQRRAATAHGNGGRKTAQTKNSLARGAEPPPADIHKLFHICLRKRSSFVKNRKTFLQFRQNTAKIGGISPADRPLFCQITKSYPHCAKLLGITLPPKTVRSCLKGALHAAMPPFYALPRKSSSARAFPFL